MTIDKKAIKDMKLEDEHANRPLLSGLAMFVPLHYHYLFRPERQSNIILTNNVHIEKRRGNNDDRHQYYINNTDRCSDHSYHFVNTVHHSL